MGLEHEGDNENTKKKKDGVLVYTGTRNKTTSTTSEKKAKKAKDKKNYIQRLKEKKQTKEKEQKHTIIVNI